MTHLVPKDHAVVTRARDYKLRVQAVVDRVLARVNASVTTYPGDRAVITSFDYDYAAAPSQLVETNMDVLLLACKRLTDLLHDGGYVSAKVSVIGGYISPISIVVRRLR